MSLFMSGLLFTTSKGIKINFRDVITFVYNKKLLKTQKITQNVMPLKIISIPCFFNKKRCHSKERHL